MSLPSGSTRAISKGSASFLRDLREIGNTVVVVEHDKEMIRLADYIIDLGPHAGEKGGELIFAGEYRDLLRHPSSLTAQYLRGEKTSLPAAVRPAANRATARVKKRGGPSRRS